MAFAIRNLSVLSYANGFTLWHYKTSKDSLGDAGQPGYLADAADMLSGGDVMIVAAIGGTKHMVVDLHANGDIMLVPMACQH